MDAVKDMDVNESSARQQTRKPATKMTTQGYRAPVYFGDFSALSFIAILALITVCIVFAPEDEPMFHFGEEGGVTALSSAMLAMSSALSMVIFYLRCPSQLWPVNQWDWNSLFWLILSGACLFLSLDEQLELHERGGNAIEATKIGASKFFRNWNDLIVIGYGAAGLAVAAVFGREILRCRIFASYFALSFFFYALHTGIDSLVPTSVAWKDIPEESAKLLSVSSLFVGICGTALSVLKYLSDARPLRSS